MTRTAFLLAGLASLALAGAANATPYSFTLAGRAATSTSSSALPIQLTSNGVTATLSAPTGNQFGIETSAGLFSFSPFLLDTNFFGASPLTISFSAPITGQVALQLGLADSYATGDTFTVTPNTGTAVTVAASTDALPLGNPEAYVSFFANGISSLTITDNSPSAGGPVSLAFGSLAVPEPATLALLGTGLVGLLAARRRRT